jgi:5-methylcytosine-specific restriction endonuclease McrA
MSKKQVWSEDGSLKRCSKCGAMKPPDSFHQRKLKSGGFGLASWCRACAGAKALEGMNAKYHSNPEWREQKLARDREYHARKHAEYRAAHPRVLLTPEERVERNRACARRSSKRPEARERNRIQQHNRRALKMTASVGEIITKEVRRQIIQEHGGRCTYCKVETEFLELDHVVPLTRGGKHARSNLVPACRACNTSKNNRTLDEWTPPTQPQKILRIGGGRSPWKLTDEQVAEIRTRRSAGERGCDLAKEFGIGEQYVTNLHTRRTKR